MSEGFQRGSEGKTPSFILGEASKLLERVEEALESCGLDADLDGAILRVIFPDHSQVLVNMHLSADECEIWLAGRLGGRHFYFDGSGGWKDRRTGTEFWESLSEMLAAHLGRPIRLVGGVDC